MKLRIEEIFWGINHRDGGYSEKVTAYGHDYVPWEETITVTIDIE